MCRDRIAETAPALLFVKTAAMASMETRVSFVEQLDPRQPLWVFLAIQSRNNEPERKTVTLRQRFVVHFVGDEGGGLHCLFEAECLVVAVGSPE
jgi:hypothetical protein